jgi:hypothetical protein
MSSDRAESTPTTGKLVGDNRWHSSVNGHAQAVVVVTSSTPSIWSGQQPQHRRV